MPRIFAPNEGVNTNAGTVDFVNGAAAVAVTEIEAIALFTAAGCDIDTSKNALTALDTLPRATLDAISIYLGVALTPGDGKREVIRDIEGVISTHLLGALTVASTDTLVEGESVIAVTEALTGTNIHKYKAAAAATPLLYGDTPDSTWTTFTSGATLTGLTTGHHCSVVECNAAGTFVYNYGDVVIDATP